jgi:uncharacterized caspase-like protein
MPRTLRALKGTAYGDVEVTTYLDAARVRELLPARLREVASAAKQTDTIMLFAAGHGFRDQATGQFYLATRDSKLRKLEETSISWVEIAKALDGSKARAIILLDACHSGAADSGTNDDAVSSLIKSGTPITIPAAAMGRQESQENAEVGGGRFTTALVQAISTDRKAKDTNRNGAIELAELYGAVKRQVVAATKGAQTPWIARNLMVGEIPLF